MGNWRRYGNNRDSDKVTWLIMSKAESLRSKYPEFIYENYTYGLQGKNLEICFHFSIPPDIFFSPKIIIENVSEIRLKEIGDSNLKNLIFHLGLAEALSYWKSTCSQTIKISAGTLNKEQVKWWKDLIRNGMGQFFYENKIDFRDDKFIDLVPDNFSAFKLSFSDAILSDQEKYLVPIGGGKDSIATLEILKRAGKNIRCFSLNPGESSGKIIKIAKCKNPIIVRRTIDGKLLELNKKGFLNGHTPFSAYLAFLSVLSGVIFNYKYLAFSNEKSSNEGNVMYLGKEINHQYSKSYDFEKKFRNYSKKYLAGNIEYFSFLRPLYELQIAKIFSKFSKYFNAFLSCNKSYNTSLQLKSARVKWCGMCPKCLFIFIILYPFIDKKTLLKIFRKDLFREDKLITIMQNLTSEKGFKPFECVGTIKESIIALFLDQQKNTDKDTYLLAYFSRKILPKHKHLDAKSAQLMKSWNRQNFLQNNLAKLLKAYLT